MTLAVRHGGIVLANARVPAALVEGFAPHRAEAEGGLATIDIGIAADGTFAPVSQVARRVDLEGRIVLPCLVDSHVHLDKAYIVRRTGLPAGGLLDAVRLSAGDAANWTANDLTARMGRALSRAHANGTAALRTHLDTPVLPFDSAAWRAFSALRGIWEGRLALQAVALMALERIDAQADYAERCRQIAALGGILGAFIAPGMATPDRLDRLFETAAGAGLDVDFHVDETLDPGARGLELICDSILRTGFGGRVMAGHCCALVTMPAPDRERIVAKVVRAGVDVVSLPNSNLFLQDRAPGVTPRSRGLTAVHELRAAGATVHFASDNVQDPFYPFGDYDMLEVFRTAVQAAHLEGDLVGWLTAQLASSARACGLKDHGRIAPGLPADAILTGARDLFDLMSRPVAGRVVLRRGVPLSGRDETLPALSFTEFP